MPHPYQGKILKGLVKRMIAEHEHRPMKVEGTLHHAQSGGMVSRGKGSPLPPSDATGAASGRGPRPPAGGPSYRGGQSTKGNISRWAAYASRPKG